MLRIDELHIRRGARTLIESFSATFQAGEVVVVLGPNGAGKSTLLQAMLGMFTATSGEVLLQDKSVIDYSRHDLAKLISWQGDLPPAEFGLTVAQRLQLAASGESDVGLAQALDLMELNPFEHRALGELSSGERQRVEIAAIMVRDNPVWLMDEPTAHLDLRHQVECLKLMKNQSNQGKLIITVLHDLQQAAAVADKVVLFDGNGGVEMGTAEEMLNAEKLEPVFGVNLKGSGAALSPIYG